MRKQESLQVSLTGHVKIHEYDSLDHYQSQQNPTVLLDDDNAVHRENASIIIARGLTHRPFGNIAYMYFGNGGATIDPLGNVILNSPNVTGAADLYSTTFFEFVDDTEGAPPGNLMTVRHVNGTQFSDADIRCLVQKNQPFGQLPSDSVSSINLNTQEFSFSEIGLKSADNLLITHITFAPVLKTANRLIEVVYTLRVAVLDAGAIPTS